MRLFETAILITLLPALASVLLPAGKRRRWMFYLPGPPLLLLGLNFAFEGPRWQLMGVYGVVSILFLATIGNILPGREDQRRPGSRYRALAVGAALLGLAIVLVSADLALQFPVFQMPEPSGSYAVGSRYYYLTDSSRPDTYAAETDDLRSVSLQIWYPAEPGRRPMPYLRREVGEALSLARSDGRVKIFYDQLALVDSHTYLDAPLAAGDSRFPVIVYSPSGNMSLHKILFEALASQGYVVICVGHPYWEPFYFAASGEVIPGARDNDRYRTLQQEFDSDGWQSTLDALQAASDAAAGEQLIEQHNQRFVASVEDLRLRAEDINFALDQLAVDPFVAGRLDLSRIGVMGIGKGGATAAQFCATDTRCSAGVNLDGLLYGDVVSQNLSQPFLFLAAEHGLPESAQRFFFDRAQGPCYLMRIEGTAHADLEAPAPAGKTLLGLGASLSPARYQDGARLARLMNEYLLAFFDKHLRDEFPLLLEGPSPDYPEVHLTSKRG